MKKAVIFDYYGVLVQQNTVDAALVAVIKELKQAGMQLFLVSNANQQESSGHSNEFPLLGQLFTKLYYSWQTGLKKPDREVYELILEENNLQPAEVVYFDDNVGHVAAASSIGIASYVYEGPVQVREKVTI
jgi:HAD superfamily hydrolase (TIGR01509 family)